MSPSDLDRVMQILSAWNMAPRPPSVSEPNPERSTLETTNTLVAEIEGKVVGVASYILTGDDTAETVSLAVDPQLRGSGVGYALQVARCRVLQNQGITELTTESDRPEVIDWYCRKFGYTIVGTHPKKHDFGQSDIDHWTVMKLDLAAWRTAESS